MATTRWGRLCSVVLFGAGQYEADGDQAGDRGSQQQQVGQPSVRVGGGGSCRGLLGVVVTEGMVIHTQAKYTAAVVSTP